MLCAGLGTRLRPFTEHVPKPLLPVMGVPVFAYAVEQARAAGVSQWVANVHHLPQKMEDGLRAWFSSLSSEDRTSDFSLSISDESRKLLGSAGGIIQARTQLGEGPFFCLNADVLSEADLKRLAKTHQELRRKFDVKMTLLLGRAPRAGMYRRLRTDARMERLSALDERRAQKGEWFFTGTSVIETSALDPFKPGEEADFVASLLRPWLQEGKVGVALQSVADPVWLDVGDPTVWSEAHFELMDRMETRGLPQVWEAMLRRKCRRLAPSIWVDHRLVLPTSLSAHSPCFRGEWGEGAMACPETLGAFSVSYGSDSAPSKTVSLLDQQASISGLSGLKS